MSTSANERLSVRITGRVQGVGFRAYATREAHQRGLSGWVRNERDGSVRLEAEGPRSALEELLDAVRSGPSTARVANVSVEWKEAQGEFDGFGVRR